MSFEISKTNVQKNPFIGLFMRTNEEYTLIPRASQHGFKEIVEKTLKTSVHELLINQSGLIGVFTAMNSKGIILPPFAEDEEIKLLKKLGLNTALLEHSFAAGNTILANDKAALVNLDIPARECKIISDVLGVEVFQHPIAGIKTVGGHNVVTNNGLLAYNETSEVELKYLEKLFNVKSAIGSINMGASSNTLGVVANTKGAVVGDLTTGFETQRIYEAFSSD